MEIRENLLNGSDPQLDQTEKSQTENFEGNLLDNEKRRVALRTAFVARFIVLREGRRSRAHRTIEEICWGEDEGVLDLIKRFRAAFTANGDKLQPIDRDLNRALEHAQCSVDYFLEQYLERSTLSFRAALEDYERSNRLLFGEDAADIPRRGGWRACSDKAD